MSVWTKISDECFQHLVESTGRIKAVMKAERRSNPEWAKCILLSYQWVYLTTLHLNDCTIPIRKMYIGGQSAAFLLSIVIKDKNIKQCGVFCFVFRLFAVFTKTLLPSQASKSGKMSQSKAPLLMNHKLTQPRSSLDWHTSKWSWMNASRGLRDFLTYGKTSTSSFMFPSMIQPAGLDIKR